jgi:hypothetical protein
LPFICFRLVVASLRKEPCAARFAEISAARLERWFRVADNAVAYVIGFFAMLAVWNWHPDAPPAAGEVKAERSAERSTAQGTPNF